MKSNYFKLTTYIALIFVLNYCFGQSQFQKLYTEDESIEVLIDRASNNDIFFVSDSYSNINTYFHRIMVQRLNIDGTVLTSKALTLLGGFVFRASKIFATSDNGLLVMAKTSLPLSDDESVNVIKLDANGNMIWNKSFQFDSDVHFIKGAIETTSGDYIIYGEFESSVEFKSSIFLMRLDASGDKVWSRSIDSQLNGAFILVGGIVEDNNQELWLSGSTRFNSEGSWVSKLSSLGVIESVTFYDTHGLTDSQPEPFAIFSRTNGERDIFYNSTSFQDGSMMLNLRTDALGVPTSTKVYTLNHINGGDIDYARPFGSNGYLFSGYHFEDGIRPKGTAFQINSNDNVVWANEYGTDYIEITNGIVPNTDNGFFIGGFADFDETIISPSENGLYPWLIKTDDIGMTDCYSETLPISITNVSVASSIYQLDETIGPDVTDANWNIDSNTEGVEDVECPTANVNEFEEGKILMYPNPANELVNLVFESPQSMMVITIRDILGKIVFEKEYLNHSTITITTNFPSGIYLVSIVGDNKQQSTLKLIKN